jgi:hypothetical protein
MMQRSRRLLIVVGVLIVAGLLAFPLRETIYESVVIPVAFIIWNLGLLYRSFSQQIWWWGIVSIVLFMLVYSLVPQPQSRRRAEAKLKPSLGQVEALAEWLRRGGRGTYFKWLIANRLGKLGYQILLHRESGRPRSVFAPLVGSDWEPAKDLQRYLEIGLHGSFVEFPNVKRLFGTPQKTPLDYDVAEAVDFLESKVENHESGHQHD